MRAPYDSFFNHLFIFCITFDLLIGAISNPPSVCVKSLKHVDSQDHSLAVSKEFSTLPRLGETHSNHSCGALSNTPYGLPCWM